MKKRPLWILCMSALILLTCSLASAQKASIIWPEKLAPGEMARFEAEYEGDDLDWIVYPPTKYSDAIDRHTKKPFIEFVPKPGVEYLVQLEAYKITDGKFSKAKQQYIFTVGPKPPKPPDPPPPPDPDDDDLTELAKTIRDNAKKVGNKVEAEALAGNYAGIISAISAGAYDGMPFLEARNKIVSDVFALNVKITTNNEEWSPFFKELGNILTKLDAEGKIKTVKDIKTVFEQIQAGLEAT